MRTRIAMALLAVVTTACGGLTEPTDPKVVGNFSLVSVDGHPIPAAPVLNGPLILGRRIEIRDDGTFTDRRRFIATENGVPVEVVEALHGEWVGHPQALRLVVRLDDEEIVRDAFVYGPWLEIAEEEGVWEFHLEMSAGTKRGIDREAVRH